MDKTKSSVIKSKPEPVNVFFVWYLEKCRRANITPCIKPAKPRCQTVLDFVADRLKLEEWIPVTTALRQDLSLHAVAVRSLAKDCQFLHEADTQEKVKNSKRTYGCILTAWVLKHLLVSISSCLQKTQVLTYLEFDGLPLFMQYLEPLLQALKKNKTLKTVSFANCSIKDAGCQLVCSYLRFTPNIEVLNLSGCHLSPVSGEHLAKLIKYQQINRYCDSWHNSLRYENPDAGRMRGIKRIIINCNPYFGDVGLNFVLDELEDDLWVKALDMQMCGFTDNISDRIFDIVGYNKTIEIIDLRKNELLSTATVEKVIQILEQRQPFGLMPEFKWCATAKTPTWSSVYSTTSKASLATTKHSLHKTRSAPMQPASSKVTPITCDLSVRKTKTLEQIRNPTCRNVIEPKVNELRELNAKLQEERQKRKEIEKRNEELQNELSQIKLTGKVSGPIKRYSISADRGEPRINGIRKVNPCPPVPNVKKSELKKSESPMIVRRKEGKNSEKAKQGASKMVKNGFNKNGIINGVRNCATNGHVKKPPGKNVYEILEKCINTGHPLEGNEEEEILNGYLATFSHKRDKPVETKLPEELAGGDSVSNSQVSLYKYMEELKSNNT